MYCMFICIYILCFPYIHPVSLLTPLRTFFKETLPQFVKRSSLRELSSPRVFPFTVLVLERSIKVI